MTDPQTPATEAGRRMWAALALRPKWLPFILAIEDAGLLAPLIESPDAYKQGVADERERLAGATDLLDVIDGIVDDTHPEGDGCPLCAALDELRALLQPDTASRSDD